jgi:hypothetical protein
VATPDLKLLKTSYFDVGDNRFAHISPEEPRLGPDGSVFVQTLGCGIERITAVDSSEPKSKLVYTFPGNRCGVPTVVGHYLVQSVPAVHGFIVLDIAHADKPTEVSRLTLSDTYGSRWTGWDPKTQRLVVTPYETAADRTYLLKLDQTTGTLAVDADFRDTDGQPGFSFAEREWLHGWKGVGATEARLGAMSGVCGARPCYAPQKVIRGDFPCGHHMAVRRGMPRSSLSPP